MATCSECGKRINFGILYEGNLCGACMRKQKLAVQAHREKTTADAQTQELNSTQKESEDEINTDGRIEKILSVLVTTETSVNLNIIKRLDIIMATKGFAFDVNTDNFEGDLLYALRRRAVDIGANAVVGVSISISENYSATVGSGNFKAFRALAVGTAVLIDCES